MEEHKISLKFVMTVRAENKKEAEKLVNEMEYDFSYQEIEDGKIVKGAFIEDVYLDEFDFE